MKLQHEDGPKYNTSNVTVHYDNRIVTLPVDKEDGTVEVQNDEEARQLMEQHGKFYKLDEDATAGHVLSDKTVDEVEEYVSDITDIDRLKELRELEDRKTGKDAIDQRIKEVREQNQPELEPETQEENTEDEENEDGEEDGQEAENE